jgi:hypothetical protein
MTACRPFEQFSIKKKKIIVADVLLIRRLSRLSL